MTLLKPATPVNHFVTYVDWDGYCKIYEAMAPNRARITYDRGKLELMSPTPEHERLKTQLACILDTLFMAFDVDFLKGGSTTFKNQLMDRGFEPDECYWLTHLDEVAELATYDTQTSPPPDLSIEVEVTVSAIDRVQLYAAFGLNELWRYQQDRRMHFYRLKDGEYEEVEQSLYLPKVSPDDLLGLLELGKNLITSQLIRETQRWAQATLKSQE